MTNVWWFNCTPTLEWNIMWRLLSGCLLCSMKLGSLWYCTGKEKARALSYLQHWWRYIHTSHKQELLYYCSLPAGIIILISTNFHTKLFTLHIHKKGCMRTSGKATLKSWFHLKKGSIALRLEGGMEAYIHCNKVLCLYVLNYHIETPKIADFSSSSIPKRVLLPWLDHREGRMDAYGLDKSFRNSGGEKSDWRQSRLPFKSIKYAYIHR